MASWRLLQGILRFPAVISASLTRFVDSLKSMHLLSFVKWRRPYYQTVITRDQTIVDVNLRIPNMQGLPYPSCGRLPPISNLARLRWSMVDISKQWENRHVSSNVLTRVN